MGLGAGHRRVADPAREAGRHGLRRRRGDPGGRRGARHLAEGDRLRRRPHPRHPRRAGRQLLADGRDGPLRSVHRAALLHRRRRDGRGVLRRGADARRQGLDGDLEPGLHAVRPLGEGGRRLPARSAAQAVRRHRRRPRARDERAPGQDQQLRDRSAARAGGQGGRDRRQAVPRVPGGRRRLDARHRGPRAPHGLPHRRGDLPRPRRAPVRAAPGHAPRDPARAPPRHPAPLPPRGRPRGGAPDGRAVPRAHRAQGPHRERDRAGGGPLPRDHRPRAQDPRRGGRPRPLLRRRGDPRRDRLQALRHVRLPDGPHRGHRARA